MGSNNINLESSSEVSTSLAIVLETKWTYNKHASFFSEFDLTEGTIPVLKLNMHIHYYSRTRDNNLN